MKSLLILSHAPHIIENSAVLAYAPYVREVNLWADSFFKVTVLSPLEKEASNDVTLEKKKKILTAYNHRNLYHKPLSTLYFKSASLGLKSILNIPKTLAKIYKGFSTADHIHLRCPGNTGLLGCFVQVLFPKTPKTVKYAGNWAPKAKQPLSYRLQKWILSNTFLTRNTKVLVYGDWPNQSKNIMSFFTATYGEEMTKIKVPQRHWDGPLEFLFVGTLSPGKRPTYALELIRLLLKKLDYKEGEIFNGHSNRLRSLKLKYFGDGPEREALEEMIIQHELQDCVTLMGNVNSEELIKAYQKSHFLILPSKSEGWPKAVAEAMFWGAIPLVTPISCIPWMIDYGQRGQLLSLDLALDTIDIISIIEDPDLCHKKSQLGANWARQYTTERFAHEIKQLF
ncbi:glycosyltransferase [Flavobacteriaceae bacterium]|nr:glycosyltransferase [Flavobacteriaceae bacterium]